MFKGIPVRVIRKTDNFVSFVMVESSSRKRLKKDDFIQRVSSGIYQVEKRPSNLEADA